MEIIGRLTADAQVSEIKDGRKVVNFNVAVNDYFKTKAGEARSVTEFFRCAYWISSHVAKLLTKGTLVSLYGRAGADAYMGKKGEPQASLRFHTSHIRILAKGNHSSGYREKDNPNQAPRQEDAPPF